MTQDPFKDFKSVQREGWALFAPLETLTTPAAYHLVQFAKIAKGESVLDVACGTGVVAVTAGRTGAQVKGLDLSPVLLERARANASMAGLEIEFVEGDAEALPYPDASFDVVVSQFGHMFAPRPAVAVSEMLRVLKKGGRIAFTTWPPELYTGRMFQLTARYLPPPPEVAPPPQWGEPTIIRERLGDRVKDLSFERETLFTPCLSAQHMRHLFETTAGPLTKLVTSLKNDAEKLSQFRKELEALITAYMKGNTVRQDFLMTRAVKL